jgi:hypothetical protein
VLFLKILHGPARSFAEVLLFRLIVRDVKPKFEQPRLKLFYLFAPHTYGKVLLLHFHDSGPSQIKASRPPPRRFD